MLENNQEDFKVKPPNDEEDWLTTYADMITLLFAFFVILFAISQIDEKKFARVAESLMESVRNVEYIKKSEPMPDIYSSLQKIIEEENLQGVAEVNQGPEGVTIRFKGSILFPTASAKLTPKAEEIFFRVAQIVRNQPYRFDVEGHTDDRPIFTEQYPSNWELSSARASTVARYLINEQVPASKMRVLGFADTKPLKPNRDESGEVIPENQEYNRRVDIVFKTD